MTKYSKIVSTQNIESESLRWQNDYYSFGMLMPNRTFSSNSYLYSFNGKPKDDEVYGEGNFLDFGARGYDSRRGQWLSVDPLQAKYPYLNPYNFTGNNPILFIDPDGQKITISFITFKAGSLVAEVVEYKNGKLFDKKGNEYTGNNEYINRVKSTLENLKNTDKRVNDVISELEGDDKNHVIANVDAQKDSKDKPFINGSYNDKTDEGGTFTKFVPDIDKKKSGSEDFSDEEILGHELKHGWNKKNNLNQSNQKQMSADNKTNCEEVDAVNFQNIIREKEGKTARTKYGKNEIPKVDLVLPKNYKLQKR